MDNLKEDSSAIPSTKFNLYLLFLGVIWSVFNHNISIVLKYFCIVRNKLTHSSYCQKLRSQLSELQKESTEIDMTNEFAKYARLQRKIIKIQDELKKEVSAQNEVDLKNKMMLRILVGLVGIMTMLIYNSQPVVLMNPEWFYPISSLLCWPGNQDGTISFLVWCAVSNSVVRTFT